MKKLSDTKIAVRELPDRIRLARRSAKLSQDALAKRLDVAASAVAQWENPRGTTPRLDKFAAIAAMTGVSVEWLMTGRGDTRRIGTRGEEGVPAITPDSIARDMTEEQLLEQFRRLSSRSRQLVVELIGELALRRGRQ